MIKQELLNRIKVLQNDMEQHSLDAYVISETDDIWYMTNITYQPEERPFFFIISKEGQLTLIVPKVRNGS